MQSDRYALPDPGRYPAFYDGIVVNRFIAWVIDGVLISVLTLVIVMMTALTALFFLGGLTLVIALLYRWLTISAGSATPGMRAVGIELRDQTGNPLTPATAFWHSALFLFFKGMFLPELLSVAMMFGSRYGQGLHDAICGVVAINRAPKRLFVQP